MRHLKTFLGITAALVPLTATLFHVGAVTAQTRAPAVNTSGVAGPTGMAANPAASIGPSMPQRGDSGPHRGDGGRPAQGATGFAGTGLCANGFAKSREAVVPNMPNGQVIYNWYECEGPAPQCAAERAAATQSPPVMTSAVRQNPGGAEQSGPFTIRVDYRQSADYHCSTPPLHCINKTANGGANYVNINVSSAFGSRLNYRCTYVWNQG
jgi:hypothetical protein